jgi:feruloyl-CoA synthase
MMIFADLAACCALCPEIAPGAPGASTADILRHDAVRERFQSLLTALATQSTGSSNRVQRAIVLEEPPSLDAREMTDKGSLNQRAVLEHRAALVEEMYSARPSQFIFRITGKS